MLSDFKVLAATSGLAIMIGLVGSTATYAANDRTVEQYTCKDVMRENGVGRSSAIAFLHGFILGKSGNTKFNLIKLTQQTDAFIDACLDTPGSKAVDVMMKIKG